MLSTIVSTMEITMLAAQPVKRTFMMELLSMTRPDSAGGMPISPAAPRIMRLVAYVDLALAVACIATPFLRTRFGLPIALMFAIPLLAGSIFCFWFAARLEQRPRASS